MIEKKQLIKWLEDSEIEITLSGGNDSGYVEINSEILTDEEKEKIENFFLEESDYGSFAGNFDVHLTQYYDSNNELFSLMGEEENYEEMGENSSYQLMTKIPENLIKIIDSINIYFNKYDNSIEEETIVRININNGIWNKELEDLEEKIKEEIDEILIDSIYSNANCDINISPKEFNDFKIITYNNIVEEKVISITVDDLLELLNEPDDE